MFVFPFYLSFELYQQIDIIAHKKNPPEDFDHLFDSNTVQTLCSLAEDWS